MKRGILVLLIILCLATSISAQTPDVYHLKLLAVQDNGETYKGSDADILLELKEGSGRVFLETFPLTKLDTQISTRFAKDVACKHFNLDCEKYDFIYTIKAKSNIIGGPSAGAAISALTTIAMLDLEYDEGTTITGTINSGGIIGPVGGVKEKLEAASAVGLQKVLIPWGSSLAQVAGSDEKKAEPDLQTYAKENLTLEVVEVLTLDEVLLHLTGKDLNHKEVILKEDKEYARIMNEVQTILCERTSALQNEIKSEEIAIDEAIEKNIGQRLERAAASREQGDFYSAASFCFASNIELRDEYYHALKLSKEQLDAQMLVIEKKTTALEQKIEQEDILTISDLQTYMVVKERINDVKRQIRRYREEPLSNREYYNVVGYAEERFFSALAWTRFFAMEGKQFALNKQEIESTCLQKIAESEERHQYAVLFLPQQTGPIQEKIETAKQAMSEGEFALCIISAAQAKADANAVLSSLGLQNQTLEHFITAKRQAVERIIAENSAEDIFPILGYSYYQYAQSLQKEEERFTALVYLEYALEMSEINIYFPEEKKFLSPETFRIEEKWDYLVVGMLLGIFLMIAFRKIKPDNKKYNKKYNKK